MFISRIQAAGEDRSPFGDFWFEPISSRTVSGARVSSETALQLSAVFRAVNLLSGHIAMLPPVLKKQDSLARIKVRDAELIERSAVPDANNADPNLVLLNAQVNDPGVADIVTVTWTAEVVGYSLPVQTGSGYTFTVNRSAAPSAVWTVRVVATDDDGGSTLFETALLVGTSGSDVLQISDLTFAQSGSATLIVMGFDGNDIIDGSQVSSTSNQLIIDGGNGTDFLFGGAGDDIYYLWRGNDNANVAVAGGPATINTAGNDSYRLTPNSVLTVIDTSGNNTLSYGGSTSCWSTS